MKRIEVVAAVIIRDGRVFATQRGYGDWKDWWEFPGGKIEPGESHQDALVREIREELATEIRVGNLLTTVEYDYPPSAQNASAQSASAQSGSAQSGAAGFHLTMHCYLCTVISGQLTLLEHEAARWLSAEELPTVNWLPADLEVISLLGSQPLR